MACSSRIGTDNLAVGITAIAAASDFDGIFALEIEENSVVTTAETETAQRGLELFHVAGTMEQVAINAVKNLDGFFPLDCPQVNSGFMRPGDRDPLGRGVLAHCFSPNSRRISSCGIPSPRASEARARSSAAAVSTVISSSSTGRLAGSRMASRRLTTAES